MVRNFTIFKLCEVDDPPESEIDQSENVSDNRNRLSSLVGVSNDIDINKDARFWKQ